MARLRRTLEALPLPAREDGRIRLTCSPRCCPAVLTTRSHANWPLGSGVTTATGSRLQCAFTETLGGLAHYGLRATPHHIEDGLAASASESARHPATGTTPGSRRSKPSKNLAVSVLSRTTICSTDRSL